MLSKSRPSGVSNALGARASRLGLLAAVTGTLLTGIALGGCGDSGGKASATGGGRQASSSGHAINGGIRMTITGNETKPGVVTAAGAGIVATLRATTHTPKANAPWPISFTVTQAGRPAKAKLSYEYLLAGAVVAKRSHYTFTGHFKDVFRWPASSVGYPLTFRAVLKVAGKTIYLDYPVKVAR